MSRILCCWELGGGLGHLFRLLPLALRLRDIGNQVYVAVSNLFRAEQVFASHDFQLFQAPVWQVLQCNFPLSLNYAQNLWRNGYCCSHALRGNLRAWMNLYDFLQPDMIVAEHAPTALLAARIQDLPRAAVGTGYTLPPLKSPMPIIQPWFSLPEERLKNIEANFLRETNKTLKEFAGATLDSVADIFLKTKIFLCTFPEFDHYSDRSGFKYWGPVIHTQKDNNPCWPRGKGEKVFIYLDSQYKFLNQVIEKLKQFGFSILGFIRDISVSDKLALEDENLKIMDVPVNLDRVAQYCSFAITQGGINTGSRMLLLGKPLLICPEQLEQALWGYRIVNQGFGVMANFFDSQPNFSKLIDKILTSEKIYARVMSFSKKHVDFDCVKQTQKIAKYLSEH